MTLQPEEPARPVEGAAAPTDPLAALPARSVRPPRRGAEKKRAARRLIVLSSAAVLTIYGIGYARTEPAAQAMETVPAVATAVSTATLPPASGAPLLPTATPTPAMRPAVTPRAPSATPTPATANAPWRDGTYVGSGASRHGSIEVTVVIQNGAIVSAEITRCGTRYPCSKIAMLPGQVVSRQSVNVDLVSGATDSSKAYQAAVMAALAKAR